MFGKTVVALSFLFALVIGSTLAFVLGLSTSAGAEGFSIYSQGARGAALNGAVLARKPDPTVIAHNPSQIARLSGDALTVGFTVINTSGKIRWREGNTVGTTGSKSKYYFIPHAYFTHQLSDRWFLGIGEFTRFGLGNEYPTDWPGRFNVYDVYLMTSSLATNVAYKAGEKLSLSIGTELVYAMMTLRNRIPLPGGSEVDLFIDKASDLSLGFNLSGHYQFDEKWAVGLIYRSPIRLEASGPIRFTFLGSSLADKMRFDLGFQDGDVSGVITLPESIAVGLSFTPIESLSLEAAATWSRWSRYDTLDLKLPGNMAPAVNPKHWKNNWRFAFGAEYALTDYLDLRFGYSFTQSPMNPELSDYFVPTKNRHSWSTGLGFHNERYSLDIAYTYVDCLDRSYPARPKSNGGNGTLESSSSSFVGHEATFSFTYHF
ncbi:MAG: outer membrane protein transport protein [Deltaproteobacteria bacterium]|jgi:long-chain fatty acid transport protein|nr:outer membrane protein transport protein [Deltaproteobacteria bacterium]